jgi:DNA-binding SARP family transcriptional activator
LNQAYLGALQELIAHFASSPDPEPALRYLEKAYPVDNLNEELYRFAMQAYATMGDRAGLVRVFQELKQVLSTELEIEPSPTTISLYQSLLNKLSSPS